MRVACIILRATVLLFALPRAMGQTLEQFFAIYNMTRDHLDDDPALARRLVRMAFHDAMGGVDARKYILVIHLMYVSARSLHAPHLLTFDLVLLNIYFRSGSEQQRARWFGQNSQAPTSSLERKHRDTYDGEERHPKR